MSSSNQNFLEHFIAGGFGGMCCVATGHPFDTIKVRIQTMPRPAHGEQPLYTGPLDCLRKTVQKEGFFTLYKVCFMFFLFFIR